MLPPAVDAVTDQMSGNILRLRRVREWRASGLGSIKLLKHGLQKAMLLGKMYVRVIAGTLTVR